MTDPLREEIEKAMREKSYTPLNEVLAVSAAVSVALEFVKRERERTGDYVGALENDVNVARKRAEAAERDCKGAEYNEGLMRSDLQAAECRVDELEKALAERGRWKNCDCAGRWHDPRCAPKGGSE